MSSFSKIFNISIIVLFLQSCNQPSQTTEYSGSTNINDSISLIKEYPKGKIIINQENYLLKITIEKKGEVVFQDSMISKTTSSYLEDCGFFTYDTKDFFFTKFVEQGTAYESEISIFMIDTSSIDFNKVKLYYANEFYKSILEEGKGIWKSEDIYFYNDSIVSSFSIYNKYDGNCCPTGGRVDVRYHLKFDSITKEYFFYYDSLIYSQYEN